MPERRPGGTTGGPWSAPPTNPRVSAASDQTRKEYGIPRGLPYLTGFVVHAGLVAEEEAAQAPVAAGCDSPTAAPSRASTYRPVGYARIYLSLAVRPGAPGFTIGTNRSQRDGP